MGAYNSGQIYIDEGLKSNICPLCGKIFRSVNENPYMDGFEYICDNCNPNILIQISGTVLASELYTDLKSSDFIRRRLREKIANSNGTTFMITTEVIHALKVEEMIEDWKKRIADLYSDVNKWLQGTEYSFKIGAKVEMYETEMRDSQIPPTEIDTANILKDNKIISAIKPRGLWVIGSNGIINVLSPIGGYTLVDEAKKRFLPPKWELYNGVKENGVEFNRESLLNFLHKF